MLRTLLKNIASLLLLALLCPTVAFAQHTPYAGQQSREIKALSSADIQGYLSGKGMGLAKTAELNHYPGPKHVLELSEPLHLTDQQRRQTRAIYEAMQQDAIRLGQLLVEAERHLDHLFATQTITEPALQESTRTIAHYHGQLRHVHLRAHLAQHRVLTPEQILRYDALRGYTEVTEGVHHHHQPH
jgi:hypothetical protein